MKILLFILAALSISCAADDLDKIKNKGELVIGVRENSPPFGFFDKKRGVVFGYDIEFALYVANKLGVKPVFRTLEPADRIPALKDGRVDVVFASLGKNADREKEIDFSLSYFVSTQKLVAKKGTFKQLSQLDQMSVCVPKGTTNAKFLHSASSKVKIVETEDYDGSFNQMASGQCDAASGPEPTMLGNLAKFPRRAEFEVVDVPLATEVFAVGMRKGQPKLQQAVNDALVESERSGEANRIFNSWFGPGAAVQLNRTFKITY
ncbi:MAG: transporter substrate-binding domain-containing protein [Burkholderiales bacterium]|nr:transporter substrate-binding domain-containing protein [Burkholderiales bacterium]